MRVLSVLSMGLLVLLSAPAAFAAAAPPAAGDGAGAGAKVVVHGREVFAFVAGRGDMPPTVRAQRAATAIKGVLEDKVAGPVTLQLAEGIAVLRVGDRQLFVLTPADAEAAGDPSLERFAEHRKQALESFLSKERRRADLQHLALSISLTVFLGLVSYLLMRYLRRTAVRLQAWTEAADASDASPLRRWLADEKIRWLAVVLVHGAHLFAQAAIVYLYLVGVFSLFERTASWREQLTLWATAPFKTVAERVATGVPTLLLLFLFLVLVQAGWHAIDVASERLSRGRAEGRLLAPEIVPSARLLLRAGLLLGAFLLLAPLLTGETSGQLARIGFWILQVIGLGLLPLLSTVALGVHAILTRRYRLGDWVGLHGGGRAGRICSVDFFHVCLATEDGEELAVPHLLALVRPLRRLPGPPPLAVELTVPGSSSPAVTLDRLRAASAAFARERALGEATVALAELRPGLAIFRVTVPGATERLRSDLLLVLAAALEAPPLRPLEEARPA